MNQREEKILWVRWLDTAVTKHGWVTLSEGEGLLTEEVVSVGFLVCEDESHVTLSSSWVEGSHDPLHCVLDCPKAIDRSAIREIRELEN